MRRWSPWLILAVVASITGIGCHGSSAVSLSVAPTTTTVLINNTVQFVGTLTGSTATITWSVPSTADGTISSSGLYTAPSSVPSPAAVTVTATADGATATATVTIQSGVTISVTPTTSTVGTGETIPFVAAVSGVPVNAVTSTCNSVNLSSGLPPCTAVTWTVTGGGTIGASTGIFTAPTSTSAGTSISVTATSVFDTNQFATIVVTLVTATDPTLVSIGPNTGARGAVFQDVFLSGTNFISTTNVFINGVQVPSSNVVVSTVTCSSLSTTNSSGTSVPTAPCTSASLTSGSTIIRVRVPDLFLATSLTLPNTNAVSLVFTVARQQGTQQPCTPDASKCQLVLSPVRPAIVGISKDSVPQGSGGTFNFNVDGGFYGTALNPVVTAQFNGQTIFPTISGANPDRQLSMSVQGSAASQPGLYQVGISSNTAGIPPATSNLAVQPVYSSSPSAITTLAVGGAAGATPSSVAINTATGLAVVANTGTSDLTFIDLTHQPTPVVVGTICSVMPPTPPTPLPDPTCPASAPTSVAIDNVRNIALVTNSSLNTISVVNLVSKTVVFTISPATIINNSTINQTPVSVGINPLTSKAVVAYRGSNFGLLLDLTPLPSSVPTITGIVNISTGANPRVAVSPKLNWAMITPGGLGSLAVVNLNQQSVNTISGATRTGGTSTIVTSVAHALQVGQPVLIQGVPLPSSNLQSDSFDGLFTVVSVPSSTSFTYTQSSAVTVSTALVGGMASYGVPVVTVATNLTTTGVAVNDQSFKAILADPGSTGNPATVFSLLDQTSNSLASSGGFSIPSVGTIGAAVNPLDNIAVVVNQTNSTGYVLDPTTPAFLTTFPVGNDPYDVAIDPGTDYAVVVNQGDNTVSIVPLGAIRSGSPAAPQVVEVNVNGSTAGPLQIIASGTLTAPAGATMQSLTIIGSGFSPSSVVRLDAGALSGVTTTYVSSRELTATIASIPATPHLYSLDVSNSGTLSNATNLTVIQAVGVNGFNSCNTAAPTGVAIDAPNNIAVVTDSNCNVAYLINLNTGLGQIVSVGTNPLGVAIIPQGGLAIVANTGSNNVSFVNDLTANVTATVATDANPSGVAIDPVLSQAAITASGSNTVDILPIAAVSGATVTPTAVGQGPIGVGVDTDHHIVAIGNATSNTVSFLPLITGSTFTPTPLSITLPLAILYDPITENFLISSSLGNDIFLANPTTSQATPVRVGLTPSSMAYNFASSTLLTANSTGGNITVVDMVSQTVRDVIPMSTTGLFSMDLHPQTNLAVVADAIHNRVLLVPIQ